MTIKEAKFRDYLIKKGYAEKTADNYTTAINVISKEIGIDFWSIDDPKLIDNIEKTILSKNSVYNSKNTIGKEMYSNGLQRYKEFLEYEENNK